MTVTATRQCSALIIPALVSIALALSTGCSSKPGKAPYLASNVGSSCYAKALPSAGEGGLAWGSTLQMARQKSMNNCIRYAGRSGGLPNTCKVVLAECRD